MKFTTTLVQEHTFTHRHTNYTLTLQNARFVSETWPLFYHINLLWMFGRLQMNNTFDLLLKANGAQCYHYKK